MTRADIVTQIANGTGLTQVEVDAVVSGFLAVVKDTMQKNQGIELRGFGTFKVKARKPKKARNPKTGATVMLPERWLPSLKFSKEFRDAVNFSIQNGETEQ